MPVFSEPLFVVIVGVCFVLGQLKLPFGRSTWFALLNLAAVTLLFGWRAALALISISVFYWTLLSLVLRWRSSPRVRPALVDQTVSWLTYGSVCLVFLAHKTILEPSNDFRSLMPLHWIELVATAPFVGRALTVLQLLAVSYVVLRLIDAIRSVLDGARLLSPLALSGYLAPFFMTPAGPVNVYVEHLRIDDEATPDPTVAHFIDSVFLIVAGYFLKFVLAQTFSIFVVGLQGKWHAASVGETTLFLIYVFFEFAGYSLVALGVGRLLSIPTPINFNHPYLATTVGEFWNRWHMSLGAFVRRNLYIPMQVAMIRRWGRKNRKFAYYANVLALWLPFSLVGLWHRLSWSFLLWGILVGAIVALEKLLRDRVMPKLVFLDKVWPLALRLTGIAYTLIVVVVTLTIAAGEFIQ